MNRFFKKFVPILTIILINAGFAAIIILILPQIVSQTRSELEYSIYPSPLSLKTSYLKINSLPANTISLELEIYSCSGKLIKSVGLSQDLEKNVAVWNGQDDNHQPVVKGIYYFCLIAKCRSGQIHRKTKILFYQ